MLGAIIAVVAIQSLDLTITVSVIGRHLGVPARELRRLSPILRVAGAAGVAALASFAVRPAFASLRPLVSLAAGAAIFGLVYLAVALATGAINASERVALIEFYRSGARRLGFSPATKSPVIES
jgi:hypothetical protein